MAVRSAAVKGAIVRDFERSAHVGYVIVFIAIILIMALGIYEALAALTDPRASIVGAVFNQLVNGGGAASLAE
jgi:hypothetical protein